MPSSPASGKANRPIAVFDCNVFLQAVVRDTGPAFACLEMAETGKVRLCISTDVLTEVELVLRRPELQQKFPQLHPERVTDFMFHLFDVSTLVHPVPRHVTFPRDLKDEPYINLAIESHADFLVSRDQDLLSLMNPEDAAGRHLLTRFPALSILDPAAFLQTQRQR